jgi:predicted GNAT family N-acyltransferase
METQTNPIPTIQVAERKASTTYTFREITEADELEQAFRLRYEVYSSCRCSSFLKSNSNEIDIDSYDQHSRHFGLFINNNEMVGYLRIVLHRNDYYNSAVLDIVNKFNFFQEGLCSFEFIKNTERADYPFLSYPDIPANIKSFYDSIKDKREGLAEGSRLIIKEQFRGIRTSIFMMECIILLYIIICMGKRHAIINCVKEHSSFYKRYGFETICDGRVYNIFGSIKEAVCLTIPLSNSLSASTVPLNLHSKLAGMAAEYSITGQITKTL